MAQLSWSGVRSCRRPTSGFTLIEVLVVLIIIGVVASFAVLSTGQRHPLQRLHEESKRVLALIELAAEEAVMRNQQLGLCIFPGGYGFSELQQERWQGLAADGLFRHRTLPAGFFLELEVEEEAVDLDSCEESTEDTEPQIWIFSSGELTPFELQFHHEGTEPYYAIHGDLSGNTEIEGPIARP